MFAKNKRYKVVVHRLVTHAHELEVDASSLEEAMCLAKEMAWKSVGKHVENATAPYIYSIHPEDGYHMRMKDCEGAYYMVDVSGIEEADLGYLKESLWV
jgi:hypothetical protein